MAFVDLSGQQVYPEGALEVSDEILLATRDLIVSRLSDLGATQKQIGKLFGVHESTACRWLQKINQQKGNEEGE